MATLVPPPSKRQRLLVSEKARQQQDVDLSAKDTRIIRVQFYEEATGQPTGPPVTIPLADASIKNLETLLNTLQGNVSGIPKCGQCGR